MHPPERDSSGLTVVDEALEIVHLRAAGAWPAPAECEPVAGMDNADAFDCQGISPAVSEKRRCKWAAPDAGSHPTGRPPRPT